MTAVLDDGDRNDPVTLVVTGDASDDLQVVVTGEDGRPLPGAFLFVEADELQTVMTGADGTVRVRRPERAAQLRIAAHGGGVWAFDTWRSAAVASPLRLSLGATGDLQIRSGSRGLVSITTFDGWSLTLLLSRLGQVPYAAEGEPLTIRGLPPGTYTIANGAGVPAGVTVNAGRMVEARLR